MSTRATVIEGNCEKTYTITGPSSCEMRVLRDVLFCIEGPTANALWERLQAVEGLGKELELLFRGERGDEAAYGDCAYIVGEPREYLE